MAEQKSNLLEEMKKQCDEYLAGWQRAKADYENLEKQFVRDRAELIKNANEDLILSLLPTLDNFEKARAHQPDISSCSAEDQKLISQWMEGVQNIYKQIFEALRQIGLERMEVLGKEFDPNTMEAVEQRKVDGKGDNEVVEEIVPGYQFNKKIIRPARVAVNKN
ncbi:nucleotide exchange factor GrpE [Candidatus Saccharibacteria bacterium]|nr:nucleotide exchange factor GrpE [Candidatus Saccharibacteria bacterium]NIV03522.1 nucleotide exchange factor GrpE [Calditrichia bacterium]NIS38067.1 nucleotide exchange factor GrpE [Candidatus Saccharibacteria bacterium]NIV71764.1 nucleotide exchange factor GrpE [Calditrichia bacterium]NIV98462.1 nucleotide exchange factor GrpE [Candidatus Saccharibacteria bacterium]